ncbi:MAG: hypothetical protein EOP35_02255 [Rubrivivax sp.]|nr:MAG: hypothetical protein EOP35_02255 [Rubrivivax sp.]
MTPLPTARLLQLVPLLAALATAAHAAPLQVSSGGRNSLGPSLSADGSRLAFYSASDLTGGNADNNFEVFLYDRGPAQMRQISNLPGGQFAGGNQTPSLSGDGGRLVFQHFESSGGYSYYQTQSYDLASNTLTTLTPLGYFESSAISRDGRVIAVSTGNLGVRLYDTSTQTFSGVVMPAVDVSMSGDGSRLAYASFSQSVRLLDVTSDTTTIVSPAGGGYNQNPVLSADGNSIAFVSSFDPLGQNGDGNAELFRYDVPTQTLIQVTHTGGASASLSASISGDGSRIAFSSSADLTGGNADGNYEVFVYDLLAGSFQQLTDTLGGVFSGDAQLSEDGLTLAYVSNMNINGGNPYGGIQVFMDTLAPQVGRALPEPATLALVLGTLALLPALRRAR